MDYVSQLKDQFAKDISQSYTGDLGLLALVNEEFCFDKDNFVGFFFKFLCQYDFDFMVFQ